jgi:hypothetical protein
MNNNHIDRQNILNVKSQHMFSEEEVERFLDENEFIKNKKLISISPGGFKGFYMLGVCKFIKENYDLNDYIFSGASAGAWNSLLLCFNRDICEIQQKVLDNTLLRANKLGHVENLLKQKMIESYTTTDFDLRRLFVGVTTYDKYRTNTTIFTGFDNLDDALNCCVASSHIPLITGGFTNIYRNTLSFDGGFSRYPYLNTTKSVLHITPNIWFNDKSKSLSLSDYVKLFTNKEYNYMEMVEKGYKDSKINKKYLDDIFNIKSNGLL